MLVGQHAIVSGQKFLRLLILLRRGSAFLNNLPVAQQGKVTDIGLSAAKQHHSNKACATAPQDMIKL